ncbi:PP2C family protein-serine/threonine phosphatase [Streptantibioticus parmotrematis]|uniref:PP2C family protein-serine/threonine phosphatase n=1 Tax=Streptantibioticus parmotrematis TaxID=2873249 RepID=UPI0033C472B4
MPVDPGRTRPRRSATWAEAPYPIVVADRAGAVVESNDAALTLLPRLRPGAPLDDTVPGWLAASHARLTTPTGDRDDVPAALPGPRAGTGEPVEGMVGDRSFGAHATRRGDGDVVWWLVETTDVRLAEATLAEERRRTSLLAEASNTLLASLNLERCTEATARLAVQHLADAAIVVGPPDGRSLTVTSCATGHPVTRRLVRAEPDIVPGLREALEGFPPVPSRWIDPAALPDWASAEGFTGPVGSVVVTPLPGHGVSAGALVLLRHGDHARFSQSEEVFARLFAARAGAALSAARMYGEQAAITATLTRELLPPTLTQVNGVEFAGGYRAAAAHERVGGDFFDVHAGADASAETLAVIGDVCGKGLDAAVLTGKIRNTLHALLPLADDHERLLNLLNGALLTTEHARFATLALASVRRDGGQVLLRLTSAGHPPPLLVRADGRVEAAATHGTLVGALPTVRASTAETVLQPGETCLMFTDGITEARGGPLGEEMFGEARLRRALGECAGLPAEAVVERVQMLATSWVDSHRHDDMAVVAITAPRHAHLSAVDGHTRGRYTA